MSEVARYLRAVVLDEELGQLASEDIQRSFLGFDLTPEEQGILAAGDHRLLSLLGEALRSEGLHSQPPTAARHAPASDAAEPAPPPPALALPEIALKVRLQPQATWEPELRLRYVANLEALPPEATLPAEPAETPPPPPPMPWEHIRDSDAVERAAARVKAGAGDRREALVDLVLAMTEGL